MANVIYQGQMVHVDDSRLEEARQFGAKLPSEIMAARHPYGSTNIGTSQQMGPSHTPGEYVGPPKPSALESFISAVGGRLGPYASAMGGVPVGESFANMYPREGAGMQNLPAAKEYQHEAEQDHPLAAVAGSFLSPEAKVGGEVGMGLGSKIWQGAAREAQAARPLYWKGIPDEMFASELGKAIGPGQAMRDVGSGMWDMTKAGAYLGAGKAMSDAGIPYAGFYPAYKGLKLAIGALPQFASPAIRATVAQGMPIAGTLAGQQYGQEYSGENR